MRDTGPCKYLIKEVWADNLEEELARLRDLIQRYPYVAMDTEFPGVVAKPVGSFRTTSDYHYQTLRCNVDLLKIIQLGVTLADEKGNPPPEVCTWQFNFHFSLTDDMYAQDSIELLTKSGIDFKRHQQFGINVDRFGETLMVSGLVLTDRVKWISFHSGYDFGYLLKMLICAPLPPEEAEFFDLLRTYFPCIYDIKYLMKSCRNLKGGLQDVADDLAIERIGPQHQAGSDSLLTCITFFKMRETFFENRIDDVKFLGHLYGLGSSFANAVPYSPAGISSPRVPPHFEASSASATPTFEISATTVNGSGLAGNGYLYVNANGTPYGTHGSLVGSTSAPGGPPSNAGMKVYPPSYGGGTHGTPFIYGNATAGQPPYSVSATPPSALAGAGTTTHVTSVWTNGLDNKPDMHS